MYLQGWDDYLGHVLYAFFEMGTWNRNGMLFLFWNDMMGLKGFVIFFWKGILSFSFKTSILNRIQVKVYLQGWDDYLGHVLYAKVMKLCSGLQVVWNPLPELSVIFKLYHAALCTFWWQTKICAELISELFFLYKFFKLNTK